MQRTNGGRRTARPAKTGRARLAVLKGDLAYAFRQAVVAPEFRRAMARTGYGLGAALAVVAALSVHEALRAFR